MRHGTVPIASKQIEQHAAAADVLWPFTETPWESAIPSFPFSGLRCKAAGESETSAAGGFVSCSPPSAPAVGGRGEWRRGERFKRLRAIRREALGGSDSTEGSPVAVRVVCCGDASADDNAPPLSAEGAGDAIAGGAP